MIYLDENYNEVERTPYTHPYSYDGFVIYRAEENSEATNTIYTDRILQQDYERARSLMQKHFGEKGDYWSRRKPKDIEKFLSEFLGEDISIVFIMECCNKSNGYPYWRIDFKKI